MVMPWPQPENDPFHPAWDPPAPHDEDARLAAVTAQRLSTDWTTRRQPITVTVQNRVVILAGTTADLETRQVAGELAWDVPGVADVCNTLRVMPRGRRQQR
ncbi:BON domain-containing protein [Salinispora arenicola]|uniref:Transport-associated n=1 Tax=Salinispora arenicola (strain CNS-205) TaxID=391037 RepID=A8M5N7_SALAI|nr:BON domain-containing protein [Salinispora arenicola]MCN0177156.1 BON domain-containing protein [Salinispora arenicola]NIL59909.1 BON domain-containing protein [Salinispora arenicola]NIL61031.1 BON domain-containing protein [Salinispora arenicola]